jgi:beta-glucuronidase
MGQGVIVSEFGGAPFALHGEQDERWAEEYQANLYRHQLKMVQRISNLAAMTPWVLMDFRSPTRVPPAVQDYHNRERLISNRGQRKLAFYELQRFYRKLTDSELDLRKTIDQKGSNEGYACVRS